MNYEVYSRVTVDEMQKHKEFDIDSNGEVSPEEAKVFHRHSHIHV